MSYNFAETADKILALQEKVDVIKTAASAKTKPLEQEIEELEQELILAMQDANLTTAAGRNSVAELKEPLKISIGDFEALSKFVIRKQALHLFERRIGIRAYEEMKESLGGKAIPGLNEVRIPKLNVKAAKGKK